MKSALTMRRDLYGEKLQQPKAGVSEFRFSFVREFPFHTYEYFCPLDNIGCMLEEIDRRAQDGYRIREVRFFDYDTGAYLFFDWVTWLPSQPEMRDLHEMPSQEDVMNELFNQDI